MALVYHNITPPEYFLGVHKKLVKLCFQRPARADCLHRSLRPRARRLRVQPPGARGARLRAHRRPAGRARLHPSRCRARTRCALAATSTTAGRTSCSSAASFRTRSSRTSSAPSTSTARATTRGRGCCWSARTAASRRICAMLHALIAQLGAPRRAFPRPGLQRGTDGALRRRRPVPLRQRARRLLRAARSRASTSGCRSWPTPRPPCPRRWTAAASSIDRRIPSRSRRLMAAVLDDPDVEAAILQSQDEALDRLRRRTSRGTLLAAVDRSAGARRHARRPRSPWDFWPQFTQAERLEELRQFRPAVFRALPDRPPSDGGPRIDGWHSSDLSERIEKAGRRRHLRRGSAEIRHRASHPPAADDHPPVDSGGASGRRVGDSAQAGARCAARLGHESEIFALTIDDDLRGDVRSFSRSGGARAETSRSCTSRCPRR